MTEAAVADASPTAIAGAVRDAPFVRLVARDDGDALAAAGLLARALQDRDDPFQVRVAADLVTEAATEPETADESDLTVTIGAGDGPHAIPGEGRPASTTAFAVARELGATPDPVLALAGVVAAGSIPGADGSGDALEAATQNGLVDRRPGVALPTADLADGLAASTLLRFPASGDPEEARAKLAELELPAELDEDAHRRLASVVAVDAVAAADASERAVSSVERALRPYATPEGPFATVGGYADVLDALAHEAPGTGVALALADEPSDDLRTAAFDGWRSHGLAAHRALDAATTGRYDGAFVVRVDADPAVLPTVARLARDFQSPEPVAIALAEEGGALAAAATEPVGLGDSLREVAGEVDGSGWGSPTRGAADFDGDGTELVAALRSQL
ncbi:exonuclease RecJ [Haloparvum sp. PAK95]|uniref:exonuclease RecJ n=1 Tax=Haloparvum sp. PAK95 TaxID=3418962 RepID=UPI003D2F0111